MGCVLNPFPRGVARGGALAAACSLGLLLVGTADAARLYEGTLTLTSVEGADCRFPAGRQLRAAVLVFEDTRATDARWLIWPAGVGVVAVTPRAGATTAALSATRDPAETDASHLELELAGSGFDCAINQAVFDGTRSAEADEARWRRLLRSTELLNTSRVSFAAMRLPDAARDAAAAVAIRDAELGGAAPETREAARHLADVQAMQGDLLGAIERETAACSGAVDAHGAVSCASTLLQKQLLAGRRREADALAQQLEDVPPAADLSRAERVFVQVMRADYLRRRSRLADAEAAAESAAELARATLPAAHAQRAFAIAGQCSAHLLTGAKRAPAVCAEALAASIEAHGETHPWTGLAYTALGSAFHAVGRFAEGLRPVERGFEILAASLGNEHYYTLGSLLRLGNMYVLFGRAEEALDIYQRTEAAFRQGFGATHPSRLIALGNVSVALRRLRRYADALTSDLQLLEVARAAYGPRDEATLAAMRHLTIDYQRLGRLDEALQTVDQSLPDFEAVYGREHFFYFEQRMNRVRILRSMKRSDEAVAQGEAVVADMQALFGRNHDDVLSALAMLTDTYQVAGRYDKARATVEDFVARFEALRAGSADYALEWRQANLARVIVAYRDLMAYYLLEDRIADAFRTAELTKARTLLETLSLRRAEDTGVLAPSDVQALGDLEKVVADLDQRVAAARLEDRMRAEGERNAAAGRLAGLRKTLRERYPRYAQMTEVQLATAEQAQRLLDARTALLSYIVSPTDVVVFVVTREGVSAKHLGSSRKLAGNIEAYRRLLEPGREVRVWRVGEDFVASNTRPQGAQAAPVVFDDVARRLAQQLLEPVATTLRTRTKWIVSPDGELAVLPFEALPFEGRPIVEQRSIAYVQSASVLALMRQRPPRKSARTDRELFAMGAPYYPEETAASSVPVTTRGAPKELLIASTLQRGGPQQVRQAYELMGRQHWEPLPGAASEVKAIHALFGGQRRHDRSAVLLGAQASEANLLARNASGELARYRYLHFAAHGHLSTDAPLLSALVLAQGENPPGIDGYVTAAEWLLYRLDSELIVLSACQSGLGNRVQGEGVMGIPYALFVAGNRRTLLSLWPVSDASTARFMTRLYTKLRAGARIVDALAEVKREFARGGPDSHPMHWAGFVLYGD